ncbi:hypothetical protein Clacol_010193 [Clathrus columnatus]|uniref:Peptidase A1 domain-containing protein n=1 Tax=Clathrus columnatus TaxID=1419009 RepID=A0AAV5AN86_9AGAM|nr:hypothetical protein Clacol_010193 [Clathrus columnatus]
MSLRGRRYSLIQHLAFLHYVMRPELHYLTLFYLSTAARHVCTEPGEGISINFSKHHSLTKADGSFDYQAAIMESRMTVAKYRQNRLNSQRNLGLKNINASQVLQSSLVLVDNPLPLTDDGEFAGNIGIGTPRQPFSVMFDTGSADLWVPSSSCTSPSCAKKNKYTLGQSSTAKPQFGKFKIGYEGGTDVSGDIVTDTVTIAGITVVDQYFSPVTTLSDDYAEYNAHGVIGMAYPCMSDMGKDPFFVTAFKQGKVTKNEFSFKLSSPSSVYLGGTDESLYNTDSLEFYDLSDTRGHWQIGGASVTVVGSGQTKLNRISGPPSEVADFYSTIPGSQPDPLPDSDTIQYSLPCSSMPSVSFNWGKKSWTISSADFNLGHTDKDPSRCIGAIAASDDREEKEVEIWGWGKT